MVQELLYDKKGKVESPLSAYQPSEEVKALTAFCKSDYSTGNDILNRPFEEFNDLSPIARANEDQKNWLNWNPGPSGDPEEDWRYFGTRPLTRNRIISTAAHLTRNLLAPSVFAQNEADEEDKAWGEVGDLLLEYNIRRSDYEEAFLYGVISGLVNPVSYFHVSYTQSYQDVWMGRERQTVLDDENSGFQYGLAPMDEILFDNAYVFKIQKQRFLIRRKRITYDDAESKYGDHENWPHVIAGVQAVLGEDNLFYDVEDMSGNMVEEVTYMVRGQDLEVPFVNGIYLGNPNTDYNPFVHRTHKNKPRYPYAKYGAEPIDAMRFYFYKSYAAKMANDQELVDRQWQMAMDGSYLETFNPVVGIGTGKIDKSFMVPGSVSSLEEGEKIEMLKGVGNSSAAIQGLREAERSANESSVSDLLGGSGSEADTAREALLLQSNAETNLGLVGNMIVNMVKDVGEMMMDDIIRYQTVAESEEILGGVTRMKYRTFILNNKIKDGKEQTHVIKFTDRYAGSQMGKRARDMEALKLLEQGKKSGKVLWEVNPSAFSRLSFNVTYDVEQMLRRNTSFERAFKLSVYDRAIKDPNIAKDPKSSTAITRDFLLEPLVGGETAKYLPDESTLKVLQGIVPGMDKGMGGMKEPVSPDVEKSALRSATSEELMV